MTINKFQIVLKQERIRRGLSQEDFARQIGTTRVTINRWENGSTIPTMYFWARLSNLLGKPIEELFPETTEEALPNSINTLTSLEQVNSLVDSVGMDDNHQDFEQEHMLIYPHQNNILQHSREQDELELEKQRLELMEKRMEFQQKQFLYARNKIETVLEVLEPQIDPTIRMKVLEATFSYLESLPFDDRVSVSLPPVEWIKKTLEVATQEHTRILNPEKVANIKIEDLEEVLDKLNDASELGKSNLQYLHIVSLRFRHAQLTAAEKGIVIRDVLNEAWERLRGKGYRSDAALDWQVYNILYYRYFKHHLKNDQIVARMDFTSTRHFFRERKKAITTLYTMLLEMDSAARETPDSPTTLPDQLNSPNNTQR